MHRRMCTFRSRRPAMRSGGTASARALFWGPGALRAETAARFVHFYSIWHPELCGNPPYGIVRHVVGMAEQIRSVTYGYEIQDKNSKDWTPCRVKKRKHKMSLGCIAPPGWLRLIRSVIIREGGLGWMMAKDGGIGSQQSEPLMQGVWCLVGSRHPPEAPEGPYCDVAADRLEREEAVSGRYLVR